MSHSWSYDAFFQTSATWSDHVIILSKASYLVSSSRIVGEGSKHFRVSLGPFDVESCEIADSRHRWWQRTRRIIVNQAVSAVEPGSRHFQEISVFYGVANVVLWYQGIWSESLGFPHLLKHIIVSDTVEACLSLVRLFKPKTINKPCLSYVASSKDVINGDDVFWWLFGV